MELKDTSSLLDWVTTQDIASAISWIISHNISIEVDIGTSIGYTNLELLRHLEVLMGETKQWDRIASMPPVGKGMTVVGKDSPLLVSGWLPENNLDSGLKWVLEA